MKLEPRVRAKAALYEMEGDSNYLLMFKNRNNEQFYTSKGVDFTKKVTKKKAAKKAAAPKVKKVAAAPKTARKTTSALVAGLGKKKTSSGFATAVLKKTGSLSGSSSGSLAAPPPLTKQQSATALNLARQGSQTHRWEFVNDQGTWSKYSTEASKLVEMEYQAWQQQPSVFVRSVRSGDWHYSVNFNTMEQTNINHPNHRVRKIRRAANF